MKVATRLTAQEPDDSVVEIECKQCDGTGVDRRSGADCWNCYGDGTILLED